MKKILSVITCITLSLSLTIPLEVHADELSTCISSVSEYLKANVTDPTVSSVGGEWEIIGLARSGYDDSEYYGKYYRNVCNYLKSCGGVLSATKYTEYARVALALTSIGADPQNTAGYNLLTPLADYNKVIAQGINGAVWALIALDSLDYVMPVNGSAEVTATREMYVDKILSDRNSDGGFSLAGNSDADVTSMAIVALHRYVSRDDVKTAVDDALNCLSSMQNEDGGFASYGTSNIESSAQAAVALSSLGISDKDSRFVKQNNTITDNIMSYRTGNGFMHKKSESEADGMATEQALYALAAIMRCREGKDPLYDMSDHITVSFKENTDISSPLPQIRKSTVTDPGRTFADVSAADIAEKPAIEALAERNIFSGMEDGNFYPQLTMTRAQFSTTIIKALGIPPAGTDKFADVSESDWFYVYAGSAEKYGIVNGVADDLFDPYGTITREQAFAMAARSAALCGIRDDSISDAAAARDILAAFPDYTQLADWAYVPTALCIEKNVIGNEEIYLRPTENITRAEAAQLVYDLMSAAELL